MAEQDKAGWATVARLITASLTERTWPAPHPAELLSREHRVPQCQAETPRPQPAHRETDYMSYIAHGSLAPDAEPHRGVVQKNLTVNGSVLAVRWRAEDSGLLRISIISFLDQLYLVMQTLQRFGTSLSR